LAAARRELFPPLGLDFHDGWPIICDLHGSEALDAALTRTWGSSAVVQSCQIRKKRNVKAHVREKHLQELERRLVQT
jgi:hypothetical protein